MSTFAEVFFGMIAAQAFRAFLLACITTHRDRLHRKEYMAKYPDRNDVWTYQGIGKTMLGFY